MGGHLETAETSLRGPLTMRISHLAPARTCGSREQCHKQRAAPARICQTQAMSLSRRLHSRGVRTLPTVYKSDGALRGPALVIWIERAQNETLINNIVRVFALLKIKSDRVAPLTCIYEEELPVPDKLHKHVTQFSLQSDQTA